MSTPGILVASTAIDLDDFMLDATDYRPAIRVYLRHIVCGAVVLSIEHLVTTLGALERSAQQHLETCPAAVEVFELSSPDDMQRAAQVLATGGKANVFGTDQQKSNLQRLTQLEVQRLDILKEFDVTETQTKQDQVAGEPSIDAEAQLEVGASTDLQVPHVDYASLDAFQRECYRISAEHGFHETDTLRDKLEQHFGPKRLNEDSSLGDVLDVLGKEWGELQQSKRYMLAAGEVNEAFEEERDGRAADEVYFVCKTCGREFSTDELPLEQYTPYFDHTSPKMPGLVCPQPDLKPEGAPIELADAVIRIADDFEVTGASMSESIRVKMIYNETRPYKHGKQF